jgi:sulfur-carrier protein
VTTLLYFAWVREQIGHGEEEVAIPASIATPRALSAWLAARGEGFAGAFADPAKLRCAVDQQMVAMDAPLGRPQEIAFFPPVTGG